MPTLEQRLLEQWKDTKASAMLWETTWQGIAEMMLPRKATINATREPGSQRNEELYDSTAQEALERFAAAVSGTVISPVIRWIAFDMPGVAGLGSQRRVKAVEQWLTDSAELVFQALQQSNFNAEVFEAFLDYGAFGTMALAIFEDERSPGMPLFRAMDIGEYTIDESSDGRVNRVFREVKLPLWEVVQRQETRGWQLDPGMVRKAEAEPFARAEFVQAVFERIEPVSEEADKFPIASAWIDVQHSKIVATSGFPEWPIPVARFTKKAGETYGRGPGHKALPEALSLNEAQRLWLRAGGKAIEPPWAARHDGVLGTPDLRPSRLNWITQENALTPLQPATRLDMASFVREDLKATIRRIFFMDQFQFVPERGKTPPSATEIQARLDIMLQLMGPTLSRLEFEFLTPLVDRVFGIMFRQGLLPEPPLEVIQIAQQMGGRIDVDFVGPIARAKRQSESASLDAALTFVAGIVQATQDPAHFDLIDVDEAIRAKFSIENAPMAVLRDRRAVQQIRQARAQAQQVQEADQNAVQASEVVRNMAPGVQALTQNQRGQA